MPFRHLIIVLIFALIWFSPLGFRDLIRSDEGRYAELAREMWTSGDWITPRLNGLIYFEKPPLQYWATALFYQIFGMSEWSARLWPALTGFAGLVLSWIVGRRYFSPTLAGFAVLVQGTMLWVVGVSHFNVLDMSVAFFLQLTLWGYMLIIRTDSEEEDAQSSRLLAIVMMGVGIAGGMLSKGLIAIVLPGMVFVADSLWHKDSRAWRWAVQWKLWLLACVLAAPWFVMVSRQHPSFLHFFFIHEHFERFAQSGHHREGAVYYFIPILLAGLLPWTFFWLRSLKDWVSVCAKSRHELTSHERVQRLMIMWSVLIFAFFSASHSKLPSYILPIFPALAWLLASSLEKHPLKTWRVPIVLSMALYFGLAVALPLVIRTFDEALLKHCFEGYLPYLIGGVVAMLAGCAWLLFMESRFADDESILVSDGRYEAFSVWALPAVLWSIGIMLVFQGHQAFSVRQSSRLFLDSVVKAHGHFKPELPFYSVQMYEQTLPFYIGRTTTLVELFDEMNFGCEHEPIKCLESLKAWRFKWLNEKKNAYATLPPELFEALQKESFPMRVLGQNPRWVLVMRY